jgi:hypothetical protein
MSSQAIWARASQEEFLKRKKLFPQRISGQGFTSEFQ